MIRPGVDSDLEAIMALEAKEFSTDRLSRRSLLYMIRNPQASVWVLEHAGERAGYAILLEHRRSKLARLYSIAIDSQFHGKGMAQTLLGHAERACAKPGIKLEVREDNIRAQRLYERSGYHHIGRRDAYYSDGTSAKLMQKMF